MGLRGMWRRVRGTLSERPYNILVVSDLHLGCELKAGDVRPGPAARRAELDRQLKGFIDWHATHRTEGRPWRLILNGDIVDFVAVTRTPSAGEETPFTVTEEERQYGLAPEEAKCVWKMRRVAEAHGEVFDALGRFLLKGNSVHIVRGNHDAEFHWPAVQAEFRRILLERAGARGGSLRRRLEKEIEFHAWFYLEPGFFYAEHGNAHDRYSLQSGFFEPMTGEQPPQSEMALPLSSQVLRYFVNRYTQGEDLDHADTWGVVEYLQWVFRMGNPLQIAADYFMMVFRVTYPVLRQSLRLSRKVARAAGRAIDRQLGPDDKLAEVRQLLGRFIGASESQVRSLLAVASRPAEQSLFDSAQLFYLDRMLLSLVCLLLGVEGLWLAPGLWKLAAFGMAGVVFAALNAVLARQRKTDAHPLLLQAARRVVEIFDVRYVAMGHSHRATSEPVGATARYFNTGSWTNARRQEGFPHVCVEGKVAELRLWKGAPEAVAAQAPAPAALPSPQPDAEPVAMPVPA